MFILTKENIIKKVKKHFKAAKLQCQSPRNLANPDSPVSGSFYDSKSKRFCAVGSAIPKEVLRKLARDNIGSCYSIGTKKRIKTDIIAYEDSKTAKFAKKLQEAHDDGFNKLSKFLKRYIK